MPSYKLIYFDIPGRAEIIRLMFAEAGVDFEDFRVQFNEWTAMKSKMPFGQLPVLEIDGKPLPQTGAIVRYLAEEFQLDGETRLDTAYVDVVFEVVMDGFCRLPPPQTEAKRKEELLSQCFEKYFCPTFRRLEETLKENLEKHRVEDDLKESFFIGKKLTYADLIIMNGGVALDGMRSGFIEEYPNLKALSDRVQSRPNIKAWLEKHT